MSLKVKSERYYIVINERGESVSPAFITKEEAKDWKKEKEDSKKRSFLGGK